MASQELTIIINAKDQASATFNNVKTHATGLGSALGSIGKIAAGINLGAAIKNAPALFMSAAQAAADDAASTARLEQAVRNTGYAFEDAGHIYDEVIKKGQDLAFSDDETRDSLSLLTAQTGDVDEATRRYAIAQDLARGANIDVVTASKLLGKVTGDNVNVLSRYGLKVKEGTTETELFGMIQEKWGGQARVFADSTAGQMARLKDRLSEIKETVGYAVLPALTALAGFALSTLVPIFEKLAQKVFPVLGAVFKEISGLARGFIDIWKGGGGYGESFAEATGPLKIFHQALATVSLFVRDDLIPALKDAGNWIKDNIIPALEDATGAAGRFGDWIINTLVPSIISIIDTASDIGVFSTALDAMRIAWDGIKSAVEFAAPIVEDIINFLGDNEEIVIAFGAAIAIVATAWVAYTIAIGAASIATAAFGVVMAIATSPITLIIVAIGLLILAGYELVKHWDEIKAKAQEVWNGLPGPIQTALEIIRNVVESTIESIKQTFEGLYMMIKGVVDLITALIHGDWSAAWEALKTIVSGAIDFVLGLMGPLPGKIAGYIGQIPGEIGKFAVEIASKAGEIANGLARGLLEIIEKLPGQIADLIGGIPTKLGQLVTEFYKAGKSLASQLWAGLKDALRSISIPINIHVPNLDPTGFTDTSFDVNTTIRPFAFLAKGVRDFMGGLALIGENGPELVNLPRGANVFSNPETQQMLGGLTVVINVSGSILVDDLDKHILTTVKNAGVQGGFRGVFSNA